MSKNLTPDSPISDRFPEILRLLYKRHPDFHCELNYKTPLNLLLATILSAQCTDVRVNKVTPILFERYPTAADIANAPRKAIEEIVYPTGFYRQKARFLQETCHLIITNHNGQVPNTLAELIKFPGAARKTANVVLGEIFGIAEGIVVDTHVKRLSNRLGMTTSNDPKKVEKDLMQLMLKEHWISISHLLIFHGRRVCKARKPACSNCILTDLCPVAYL